MNYWTTHTTVIDGECMIVPCHKGYMIAIL